MGQQGWRSVPKKEVVGQINDFVDHMKGGLSVSRFVEELLRGEWGRVEESGGKIWESCGPELTILSCVR